MEKIALNQKENTLIARMDDGQTKIVFQVRRTGTTLVIEDYFVERFKTPLDTHLVKTVMHAIKARGVKHVLTDEFPDGMLPWCTRKADTLHCNLSKLH